MYVVVVVGILVSDQNHDMRSYRAAGLPESLWRTHTKITATLMWLLVASFALYSQQWIPLVIISCVLAYRLLSTPRPPRDTDEVVQELAAESEGSVDFGSYPVTLAGQLVYRRLHLTWILAWVSFVLAALLGTGITMWMGEHPSLGQLVWLIPIVLFISYTANQMRDSLLDFMSFGGTRAEWARAAALSTLVSVAIAGVLTLLVWLWRGDFTPYLLMVGCLFPVVQACAEFARNWAYSGLFLAATIGLLIGAVTGKLGDAPVVLLTAAVYVAWALTLPGLAKRSEPFKPAVGEFFGFKSAR